MSSILGLINTESFSSDRFKNYRRTVFYYYPQGAAPLTGLLSLLKEEATNDPQFFWYEKRKAEQRTITAAIATTVVFYATAVTVSSAGKVTAATAATADFTATVDVQYAVKTAADPQNTFRIGHLVKMVVTDASAVKQDLTVRINAINGSTDTPANVIGFIPLSTVASIDWDVSANVGVDINVVGSAFAEGAVGSSDNILTTPVNPSNYTQIFRTAYRITGTALKTSAKYDERGVFPDEAKEAMLNHSTEMEKNFLWGVKNQNSVTSGGVTTITRTTGGFMYFLRQWEAGTTYGNTSASSDSDDTKRIIINSTGRVVFKTFLGYMERVFRMTNNKTSEKLAFVGSGAMNILTQLFASKVVQMQKPPAGETYGMEMVKIIFPFGTLYLKTHPLFTENPIWRNSMLILDVPNLRYRYVSGRDTELLRDRQPNNADYIEHEYLTECGLEVDFPESGMYIQNILDWEP
jgi:hypothetical protein